MPKNTIRDILLPDDRRQRKPMPFRKNREENMDLEQHQDEHSTSTRTRRKRRFPLGLIAIAIVVILIIGLVGVSFLFAGAEVIIEPKQAQITVNGDFTAEQASELGTLGFEVMNEELSKSAQVPATGREEVERKASGTIVVYNDHSTASQRLIRNTRFETPGGLIYRIDESIVVPGQVDKDGKTVPGSIEAVVYADEPGEQYNTGLTDFTVPGFKGSPQFENFYARSKTPISGGFVGEELVVDELVEEQEREKLRTNLKEELMTLANTQKPEGFILFDDAIFITFETLPSEGEGSEVRVVEKATLHVVLFEEVDFAKHLAKNTLAGFDETEVRLVDPLVLSFSTINKQLVKPWEEETFSFHLEGSGTIVWEFDQDALKNDLSGRNKDAIHTILSGYPGIDKAEVVIRPFWRNTFPQNVEDIQTEVVFEPTGP